MNTDKALDALVSNVKHQVVEEWEEKGVLLLNLYTSRWSKGGGVVHLDTSNTIKVPERFVTFGTHGASAQGILVMLGES